MRRRSAAAAGVGRPGRRDAGPAGAVLPRRPAVLRQLLRQGPYLRRLRLAHSLRPRRRTLPPGAPPGPERLTRTAHGRLTVGSCFHDRRLLAGPPAARAGSAVAPPRRARTARPERPDRRLAAA